VRYLKDKFIELEWIRRRTLVTRTEAQINFRRATNLERSWLKMNRIICLRILTIFG